MKTLFPDGLDDFNLTLSRANRNTATDERSREAEDAWYLFAEIERKLGMSDSDDPYSDDYRISQLETIAAASRTFTQLSDVPNSFIGYGGKAVYVKDDCSGLEFITGGAGTSDHALLTHLAYADAGHTGFSPTIHNLVDTTNHPVTGLTTGHFLKALSATTYSFAAHGLTYSDVGAAPLSHSQASSTITDWGTYINQAVLTSSTPTFAGLTISNATNGINLLDPSSAYYLKLVSASTTALNASRTLTFDVDNSSRTLKFSGNPTLGDWFDQSVKTTANPTFGVISCGVASSTTSQLIVAGGASGGDIITLVRTVGATLSYSWNLAGAKLSFNNVTSGKTTFQTSYQVTLAGASEINVGFDYGGTTSPGDTGLIKGSNAAAGTDLTGGNLYICPGRGTGAAVPSKLYLQTTTVGASGTTLQTMTTRLTIDGMGTVTLTGTLIVDTNILVADATNDRVGIGTTFTETDTTGRLNVRKDGAEAVISDVLTLRNHQHTVGNTGTGIGLRFKQGYYTDNYKYAEIGSIAESGYSNAVGFYIVTGTYAAVSEKLRVSSTGNLRLAITRTAAI